MNLHFSKTIKGFIDRYKPHLSKITIVGFLCVWYIFAIIRLDSVFNDSYVYVEAICDRDSFLDIYWERDGKIAGYPFDEENKVSYPIRGETVNSITASLPNFSMEQIRIDFGNTEADWILQRFDICHGIKKYKVINKNISDNLTEINFANIKESQQDFLNIDVVGYDGYIALNNIIYNDYELYWRNVLYAFVFLVFPIFIYGFLCLNKFVFTVSQEKRALYIRALELGVIILDGFVLAIFFDRFILTALYRSVRNTDLLLNAYLRGISNFSISRILFWTGFLSAILYVCVKGIDYCFPKRYIIVGCLFVFLVAGRYHGSSMGFLSGMLGNYSDEYHKTTLLGINQGLRGDEWAVSLPLTIAQYNNKKGLQFYNENLMLEGYDAFVGGLPSNDLIELARPSNWGYHFLPLENAMAFNWWLFTFLLFLSSIDMAYELTENKKLSIVYGLLIVFSPGVQWWTGDIAIICLVQIFVVALSKFLKENSLIKKAGYTVLAALSVVCYVFILYPAWLVPFGYVYIIMIGWLFWKHREKHPFSKFNILAYLFVLAFCAAFGIRALVMSGDAINTQLNTVYPGAVNEWATVPKDIFMLQLINFSMAWGKYTTYINNSEISQFFDMFPWSVLLFVLTSKRKKWSDERKLMLALIICNLFFLYFMFGPRLGTLYKFTLMSFTYPRRVLITFGYIATLLLVLAINEVYKSGGINKKVAGTIATVIGGIAIFSLVRDEIILEYIDNNTPYLICFIAIIGMWGYFGFTLLSGKGLRKSTNVFLIFTIISTLCVHPIGQGADDLLESGLIKKICEIKQNSDGRWMVSGNTTIANMVSACGIKRTSGTYVYPDIPMMEIIDPEHRDENAWNSYAHISMELSNELVISNLGAANLDFKIPAELAKKLDVEYIVVNRSLDDEIYEGCELIKEYNDSAWYIYKIVYNL